MTECTVSVGLLKGEMNLNMQELRYAKDVELDPIGGKEIYRDGKQRRDDKIFILEFSF